MLRPTRNAVSIQLLTQYAMEQGLSAEHCLSESGLSWDCLSNPETMVSEAQELHVVGNLLQAIPQQAGMGLTLGRRYRLNSYGIWGFALLASPSFRHAAKLGLHYLDLTYAFHHIRLEESDDQAYLVLQPRLPPSALNDFLLERDLGGLLQILRELYPLDWPLLQVELQRDKPRDPTIFEQELALTPLFSQPNNRCVFPKHLLDQPLTGTRPTITTIFEEQCQQLLDKRRPQQGLAGQIRSLLLERPGQLPNMEQIAKQLNMSSRSLRRRLDEQDCSFRQLLDGVRQTLAEELLTTGALTLEDIAERLGYGEVSNFIHAFKRWKGMSPRRYQRGDNALTLS